MESNPVDKPIDNSLAAIFTMMLPGLGQMLQGKIIPGIIWSVLVGGGYLVSGWIGLAFHVTCILDAALMGGLSSVITRTGWFRKCILFAGLTALIIYTCLRTALF